MKKSKKKNLFKWWIGIVLFVVFWSLLFQRADQGYLGEQTNDAQEWTSEAFIERLAPHARELQAGYGILPSIILGQAILESNFGNSTLANQYNNLFGVKAYGNQPQVKLETQEFVNNQWITINGAFRVYDSWEASMDDHTRLFVEGVDWQPQKYEAVLTAPNYRVAAQALQDAGYATDPTYAKKIIDVIETYKLARYD